MMILWTFIASGMMMMDDGDGGGATAAAAGDDKCVCLFLDGIKQVLQLWYFELAGQLISDSKHRQWDPSSCCEAKLKNLPHGCDRV